MSEYDVLLKLDNEDVMINIPDIFRDDDSETTTEQIKIYLSQEYEIDYYTLKLKLRRKNKSFNEPNDMTIVNGDKLEFVLTDIPEKLTFKLKTGFYNTVDKSYSQYIYSETIIETIETQEEKYMNEMRKICDKINEIITLTTNDSIKDILSNLMIFSFDTSYYYTLPFNEFKNLLGNRYIYFGKVNNGRFTGFGILYNCDLNIYYQGIFSGLDITNCICVTNTHTTRSCFVFLKANGLGDRIYNFKNETYDGPFLKNEYEYNGILVTDEFKYNGGFTNGKFYGYGRCRYSNGDTYKGYWSNGKKNVFGKMLYFNKSIYTGIWKDDLREEFGCLHIPEILNNYVGTFYNNEPTYNDGEYRFIKKVSHKISNIIEDEIQIKDREELPDNVNLTVSTKKYDSRGIVDCSSFNLNIDKKNNHKQLYSIGEISKNGKRIGLSRCFYNNSTEIVKINELTHVNKYSEDYLQNKYKNFMEVRVVKLEDDSIIFGMIRYSDGNIYIGDFKNKKPHGSGKSINLNGEKMKCFWYKGGIDQRAIF